MWKHSTAVLTLASSLCLSACGVGSNTLRSVGGALAPCSGGPHCVNSMDPDPDHQIAPIHYVGTLETAKAHLKSVLVAEGAKLVRESDDYLHAEYTTTLMRYVDDVEFVFTQAGRIDVRSSSRIGYADFGTNRNRVEGIRTRFAATAKP